MIEFKDRAKWSAVAAVRNVGKILEDTDSSAAERLKALDRIEAAIADARLALHRNPQPTP